MSHEPLLLKEDHYLLTNNNEDKHRGSPYKSAYLVRSHKNNIQKNVKQNYLQKGCKFLPFFYTMELSDKFAQS